MSISDEFTEAFERHWPHETVTSLRQIQALYGAIEEANENNSFVVPQEYQLYITPGELEGFTTVNDDDNRLVTVRVDLTSDGPQLAGVDVNPLRPDDVAKLGFSDYSAAPRGIDHSITRRGAKGGSTRKTITSYCMDCLERWTNADERQPTIGKVAESHPDGWVIESLQSLGLDESTEDDIRDELWAQIGEDERVKVVTTVAIQLRESALESSPSGSAENGFYYPAQLEILNSAMKARKEEKMSTKNNKSGPPSRGEGVCLVAGEETEVFGTTDDPLKLYSVQHAEKFSELKKGHSWRDHPLSSEMALLILSGASLVDQCRRTRRGRGVYTIPYFTQIDAERAGLLQYAIADAKGSTESLMADLQTALEKQSNEVTLADLRYYVVALRNDSGDINVLHEVPDATVMPVRELADAHLDVLDGSTFDAVAGFDQPDNWQPITSSTDEDLVIQSVTSGFYAVGTLARPSEDDPSTDDPSEWLTFSLLTGESVPVQRLLGEYVARLSQERDRDADERLSENHLKAQYAQLEALARADKLLAPEHPELSDPPRMSDHTDVPPAAQFLTDDGKIPIGDVREYRLQRFLDERPAFTNDSRRGAFLAGVLVGQLGNYQGNPNKRNMNRTVLVQYPAEQMSGDRISRLVPELVGKANVYASDDEFSGPSLFPELDDRLPAALEDAKAEGWSIPVEDLRFHYALGQLYGKRAVSRGFDLRTRIARNAGIDLETDSDSNSIDQ